MLEGLKSLSQVYGIIIMDQLRISGKVLGEIALPNFCRRCFWIKMRCKGKLPFQIFPGIFSSIDSYSKKITTLHYQKSGEFPKWFKRFGEFEEQSKAPHHSKFNIVDQDTNILLTGAPDEILKRADGSYFIIDYKTAKFTDIQDSLLPLYEVQLNAYAFIGNATDFYPISGIGLIYYEPVTDISKDDILDKVNKDSFDLNFRGYSKELKLNLSIINKYFKIAREIYDKDKPPTGLNNCRDCANLSNLMDLINK